MTLLCSFLTASYQAPPQYANPLPPPVSYAPAPYQGEYKTKCSPEIKLSKPLQQWHLALRVLNRVPDKNDLKYEYYLKLYLSRYHQLSSKLTCSELLQDW